MKIRDIAKNTLQDGEYLYIYMPTLPVGLRKECGELQEFNPLNPYRGWSKIRLKDLLQYEGNPARVFPGLHEFFMELRRDYLEPALQEAIISGSETNYRAIQEDVDELSGRAVQGSKEGYYFVGATYDIDDFYYVYWSPGLSKFRYTSCVGNPEETDPTRSLEVEQIKRLREEIKEIHGAPFPSALLLSPLG